jgi:hypothetical protein
MRTPTYRIERYYYGNAHPTEVIKTGLTLEEVMAHCNDPETSSETATSTMAVEHTKKYGPWFDGYTIE